LKKSNLYIGTSGWNYKHWIGVFYPETEKQSTQLQYYQQFFNTVELNNSFYHLPDAATFKHWKESSPKDFLFSVKASRYITHMKKLKDAKEPLHTFLSNARGLGRKLGPVLFQLPPHWQLNLDRLHEFLKLLPKKRRFVFEFRNASWYNDGVYDALRKYNCAFCIYELAGHQSPAEVTADFIYIRLHGPGDKYQGNYSDAALKKWARQMINWQQESRDVYTYFDNDQAGYAVLNAKKLKKIIDSMPLTQ
jgi:uncharacterized protein YecE (DUF72 family)